MNDDTTEDYLHRIIGLKLFGGKRLLAWDAFGSHKSERTVRILKELNVEAAYIPGGCTKYIQAVRKSEGSGIGDCLDWIDRSWQELSRDLIVKSFEVCGLTTPTDGTGDERIMCFKPDGPIGERGIELLREFRAKEMMKDGRNDDEEAGLSGDEKEVDLDGVGEDDELIF